LEEIDTMYLLHVPPRKSSKWEVPVGEELVTAERIIKEKHGKKGSNGGVGEGTGMGHEERIETA
jgi:MFS transporter, SP family, sugar:H+ symporter